MVDTIFMKIVRGEIPSHKVYEDDKIFAFLDIHPATEGHTLVITKEPFKTLDKVDEQTYLQLMKVVQMLMKKIKKTFDAEYVSVLTLGMDVPHVHVHLLPFTGKEIDLNNDLNSEPDHAALAKIAEKLTK